MINKTYSWRVRRDMIRQEVKSVMKIDRLIGILSVLLQKEKITAPELAEKFVQVAASALWRDTEWTELC